MREPHWAHLQGQSHRLRGDLLLLRPAGEERRPEESRRGRPEAARDLRETRRAAARARTPRRGGGRCGVRQRVGRHHLQGAPGGGRRGVLPVLGSRALAPAAGRAIPRQRGALHRQFLCDAQLRGVLRRLVRLRAAGRALPDGAVDLLSHQRRQYRPVRAHADHRRQGQPCELPRGLHGAERDENQLHAAVVELVALDDA